MAQDIGPYPVGNARSNRAGGTLALEAFLQRLRGADRKGQIDNYKMQYRGFREPDSSVMTI
ncbi:hypothetical protein CEE69_29045 [Rhodopirellula bahusiensis]|uniref:Uncharacterized protein n=1 Tax=Rhodopirellula bahusiensis TaxID=2014065 RepID=A0A2G1VZI4_9BACT|nr:hypothetical protein CEE69_29045 [Rhodopirellula bahusiensis]